MQPQQLIVKDKEGALDILTMDGLIEKERIDPVLLNMLLEDLLIMPALVQGRGEIVYLPGPEFGLRHLPVYVSGLDRKNIRTGFHEFIDKKSASAARNIMLFKMFQSIDEAKHLINGGNYSEAYEIIQRIEYDLCLIKTYYPDETYNEIESGILTLKRKIEIEINIFHLI